MRGSWYSVLLSVLLGGLGAGAQLTDAERQTAFIGYSEGVPQASASQHKMRGTPDPVHLWLCH
jgi:hypothetical protein